MRKINLQKINDVRRLLSRVANMLLVDEISIQKANSLSNLCNVLARCIEKAEMEEQIRELKSILKKEGIIK